MNRNEVVDLLSAITAYDNRNPAAATVLAWSEAAERGRWTFREALEAVHRHYAESTDFLMPAHITESVRAARQDRAQRQEQLELEAMVDPAAAARVAEVVAEVAQKLRWGRPDTPERRAMQVRCPHCHAAPGVRCVSPSGHRLVKSPCHPSRLEALGATG